MNNKYTIFFVLLILSTSTGKQIFRDYWDEAEEIVKFMTLDQKIGQMTQADIGLLNVNGYTDPNLILQYNIGSVLVGGDSTPDADGNILTDIMPEDYDGATMENWQKLMDKLMNTKVTIANTWDITMLSGTDAVHGNQHILGEVLFPHNIGMAATGDPKNFENSGHWTARSVLESGFNYIFAPCVAVSHNAQWSRYYESLGFDEKKIYLYANALVRGATQQSGNQLLGVATSAKHFIGDGATMEGIDEGNTRVYDFQSFYKKNMGGYKGAIAANVATVMASYSSILGYPMSINAPILTDKLKFEEGFDGFIISDYDELGKIAEQGLPTGWFTMHPDDAVCYLVNAGIDMMMLPVYKEGIIGIYQNQVKMCLENGDMHIERVNDAAKRVVAVKLAFKLIQNRNNNLPRPAFITKKGTAYEDALKAAQESLVLLKNDDNLLPLKKDKIQYVIFIGDRIIEEKVMQKVNGVIQEEYKQILYSDYDNIGTQCGGWTIRWQGFEGNRYWTGRNKQMSQASSILDGIKKNLPNAKLIFPDYKDTTDIAQVQADREAFFDQLRDLQNVITADNTVIIGALSESPYAEFMGDVNTKYCRGTVDFVDGCLYNLHASTYQPLQQRTTLELDYTDFEKDIIRMFPDVPVITVLIAGRTMIINEPLSYSKAFIAAWLPGTTGGEAVANAIVGKYLFGSKKGANKLPADWTADMASLQGYPVYLPSGQMPQLTNVLFYMGYGLTTTTSWFQTLFW